MTESRKVVIAGYARSPFTPAAKGQLADVRADDLAAQVIRALIKKTGVDPALIEDLKLGCAMPEGEQGLNVARPIGFLAGLPESVPAMTVNRFCASSMQAIHDAAGAIAMGMIDCAVAGGVESMTRVPMGGFNPMPNMKLYQENPGVYMSMGETMENVAEKYNITRMEQDAFAVSSQFKTAAAKKAGHFDDEIVTIVKVNGQSVSEDGSPRPDTTMEGLAKLKPAFKENGTVTAATASPMVDGAAFVLVCSEEFALKHGLTVLSEIVSFATTGVDPTLMGIGPITASEKAMQKAGITVDDLSVVEINEASASQSIASLRSLGIDFAKANQDGGSLSLGHPLAASPARLTGKASQLLKEGEYALVTMCIGGGMGSAMVLKK
jgi:acetyl-CoA acyltransferase